MSGNDTRKLTETFAKPAKFKGTQDEYVAALAEAVAATPQGLDGDSARHWVQAVGLEARHISAYRALAPK